MIILILLALFFTDFRQPVGDGIEIYQVVSGDRFYDSGGPDGTYINCTTGDQCTSTSIICGPGAVSLSFKTLYLTPSLSAYGDHLKVFSGAVELYSSLSGVSPVGQIFTSREPSGCLVVTFTSTSIAAGFGWNADITVTGTVSTPPTPTPRICNLVCKASVMTGIGIYNPGDFIMNPGYCSPDDDYILEIMHPDGSVSDQVTPSDIGQEIIYKVWLKNKKNHCWGYINAK
ncbi:MAG: hypothetical protein IPF70_16825 [Saprospiraceae bacterium]|nr:hypothetical protein [Saprospiraceae bacterium]